MRIKALFVASLMSACTAATTVAEAQTHQNFLLGVQGGLETRKGEFATDFTSTVGSLNSENGARQSVTDAGSVLGVLGGWQWHCRRILLGVEASYDFQSFEKNRKFVFGSNTDDSTVSNNYAATVKYDRGPTLSMAGRAGYFVTPYFMPYVKAGGQVGKDELAYQVEVSPSNVGTFTPDFISKDKTIWGFLLGVGMEFPLVGPSAVRVEYNYIKTSELVIPDSVAPVFGTHRYQSPRSNVGRVAWVWNFL